ncbi:MAG: cyclic nucleotide-binding domain-containing protein [Fimbriimonadaceae bacterium]
MDLFERVKSSYLSRGLLDDEVAHIVAIASEDTLEDGATIVRAGDLATDFFLVLDGKVIVRGADGEPIGRLAAGAIIGEVALLTEGERTATVVSDGPTVVAHFPGHLFNELIDREPSLGVRVLRNIGATLVDRLQRSNIQLERVLAASGF